MTACLPASSSEEQPEADEDPEAEDAISAIDIAFRLIDAPA
jgi:hypothetical protein